MPILVYLHPTMANELTAEQYKATISDKMRDLTDTDLADSDFPAIAIWEYVKELVEDDIVLAYVYESEVVEKLYRNGELYDHVLLPSHEENVFVVIIIDLETEEVFGHHILDVNQPGI